MSNLRRAWACALDVEGWLNLLTAGLGGPVAQVAGRPGEVGLSLLNTYTIRAHRGSMIPFFQRYVLVGIKDEDNEKWLQFEILTNGNNGIVKQGILEINEDPTNKQAYILRIGQNLSELRVLGYTEEEESRWKSLVPLLEYHFEHYIPRY